MKPETMLEFIVLPEGVTIDLKPLNEEWNRQYNGMVKTVKEESSVKAVSDLLSKYGFKDEEAIKTLQDSTKDNKVLDDERFKQLQGEFETLTSNLKTKDAELLKQTQLTALGKLNIRADKLESAYKLISSDINDDNNFETVATKFVESTPEWIGEQGPGVNLGEDNGGTQTPPVEDGKKLENMW